LEDNPPINANDNSRVFYLSIPYVDDKTNRDIKKALNGLGHNIRLAHRSPNLNMVLNPPSAFIPTRNGQCDLKGCRVNSDLCFRSIVIYEAICLKCSGNYIGSTKKYLHTRIAEHFKQSSSQIHRHNATCKSQWSFKIRSKFQSIQSMRWGEAILIQKDKPILNKKDDGSNRLPFVV
jgi:hypothetical protein